MDNQIKIYFAGALVLLGMLGVIAMMIVGTLEPNVGTPIITLVVGSAVTFLFEKYNQNKSTDNYL